MSDYKNSGKPKGKGGFKGREGGFAKGPKRFGAGSGEGRAPRREGGFGGPRREGGFKSDRREGGFRSDRAPRGEGSEGGFRRPRRDFSEGEGAPRGPRRESGADEGAPRRPRRDFEGAGAPRGPRREGGFKSDRREGGFRSERGPRREGGFDKGPRREGGFGDRKEFRGSRGPNIGREPRAERPERGDDSVFPQGFERPHVEKGETYYHGRNACLALFKQRPRDIIRVYVKKGLEADFKDLLNYCAAHRLAFHVVGDADLERITDTKHHDGICVLAREKRFLNDKDFYKEIGGGRTLVLYLDGVGNPHNLGAIMRTASHFGVQYIAGEMEELPRISPSANRTSEGGSESVSLVRVEEPEGFFDRLKKQGFQVYAFDPSAKAVSLFDITLNEKAVFVMGAEVEGLSGLAKSSADVLVRIPGTGVVESLNVSVAAALAMAEFSRQQVAPRNVRIVKKRT